jgi:hypothetical protein
MTYTKDISILSISMMCLTITAEYSTNFKSSPSVSKLARGYRDMKILRVRLIDCFMLARIISPGLVGMLFNI